MINLSINFFFFSTFQMFLNVLDFIMIPQGPHKRYKTKKGSHCASRQMKQLKETNSCQQNGTITNHINKNNHINKPLLNLLNNLIFNCSNINQCLFARQDFFSGGSLNASVLCN